MSYSSEHIQIMDMRFSAHVTVAEFEQWLSQVERFFLKKTELCFGHANRSRYGIP